MLNKLRMKNKTASDPAHGVYAALVTPRRPNSIEADTSAYLDYIDKVCSAGVDGLVFFGSTGEFVHFDTDERMRVVGLTARRSTVPVFVNVSHSTFSGARDLADHAVESGAKGLLVMPPYFYTYSDDEVRHFFKEFRTAVDRRVPLFLYNLPFFTTPISLAVLDELLSSGAYAGIKDSSGDWNQFQALRDIRDRQPFQLFVGHERIYAQGLRHRADGIVSGVAAAIPELPVAMKRAAEARNEELLAALSERLDAFVAWIPQFPSTVAIKEAAESRNWIRNTVSVPLSPQTTQRLIAFRSWLGSWLPGTLALCDQAVAVRP
jgi:4-hydroxy-tetrahydrodipicolinate synthase